jgi:type IV pilus biogenesis protein CpaD/CtpE
MNRIIILAAFSLAACAESHQHMSQDFGVSVRANIAAQVVNPQPSYGVAETDGTRIQNAIHRYETNKVYVPQGSTGSLQNTGAGMGTGGGGDAQQ